MSVEQNIPLPQLRKIPACDQNRVKPIAQMKQHKPNIWSNWSFFARYKLAIVSAIISLAIITFLFILIIYTSFTSVDWISDKKHFDVTKSTLVELETRLGQQNTFLSMEGQLSYDKLEAIRKGTFNFHEINETKRFKRGAKEDEIEACRRIVQNCLTLLDDMYEMAIDTEGGTTYFDKLLKRIDNLDGLATASKDVITVNINKCRECKRRLKNSPRTIDDTRSSNLAVLKNSDIKPTISVASNHLKDSQGSDKMQFVIDTFLGDDNPDSFEINRAAASIVNTDSSMFKKKHDSSEKYTVYFKEASKSAHSTKNQRTQNMKNVEDVIHTSFPKIMHESIIMTTSKSGLITEQLEKIQPTVSTYTKVQPSLQQEPRTILFGNMKLILNDLNAGNTTNKPQMHGNRKTTPITPHTTESIKDYDIKEISNIVSPDLQSREYKTANHPGLAPNNIYNDRFKGMVDFNSIAVPTSETTISKQQSQYASRVTWITRPVCFYGSPFSAMSQSVSTGNIFSAPSSPAVPHFINSPQFSREQSFLYPMSQPEVFIPNNINSRGQSPVEYINLEYQSNPAPMLPQVGPTGPSIQNIFLNQGRQIPPPRLPYYCTFISTPTVQVSSAPTISEFQRKGSETSGSSTRERTSEPDDTQNRQGLSYIDYVPLCDEYSHSCADGVNCVTKLRWCDGKVDCPDASDETRCSCIDRIGRERLCDGYFDCPQGEDELGCFDCNKYSFSCDDLNNQYRRKNCVPLYQRCDGIKHCANGKDEMDCSILTHTVHEENSFIVGYTEGYLHKNWQGRWYPACSPSMSWATEACVSETGLDASETPTIRIKFIPENVYDGPYLVEFTPGEIKEVSSCYNRAIFVRCSPILCGTRVLPHDRLYYQYYNERGSSLVGGSNTANSAQRPNENINKKNKSDESNLLKLLRINVTRLMKDESKIDTQASNSNNTIVSSESRVVGGQASQPQAWPFLVVVIMDGHFHCGGTIINEYWILTAAHCVHNHSHYFEIQAGILRRFSFSPMAQSRQVKNIIIHRNYDVDTMKNDLALMKLDKPLHFNRWVRPACLPKMMTTDSIWKLDPLSETSCVIAGWGAIKEHGSYPDHLREVEVPILPNCKQRDDRNDVEICAGEPQGGTDACQGDSGGPLMCRNPNSQSQWYVAGIVSHGEGCARPDEPGAYTRVSRFVDWIEQIIDKNVHEYPKMPLDQCPGFNCESGLRQCVSNNRLCDKTVDCFNAEDELNCDYNGNSLLREFDSGRIKMTESNSTTWIKTGQEQSNGSPEKNIDAARTLVTDTSSIQQSPAMATLFNHTFKQISKTIDQARTDMLEQHENMTDTVVKTNILSTTTESPIMADSFICNILTYRIPINKRCDGKIDCEDGTDEENCACLDHLKNIHPNVICDGYIDCYDKSDEENCAICNDDEFHCKKSNTCIPLGQKCDNNQNCAFGEDEEDCFSLTNGQDVYVDLDGRPDLNVEGILTKYSENKWQPICDYDQINNESMIRIMGQRMCENIGFGGVEDTRKELVYDKYMEIKSSRDNEHQYAHSTKYIVPTDESKTCIGFYIRCRAEIKSKINNYLLHSSETKHFMYLWPWNAAIFADGRYLCTAVLLDPAWLLTNFYCMKNVKPDKNYITVLLGMSRLFYKIDGPYQQIIPINEIRYLKESNAVLLHLKKPAKITRHVHPIFIQKRIYQPTEQDICMAVGLDEHRLMKTIFLNPVVQCPICHRCYKNRYSEECTNNTNISPVWCGTVVCLGSGGWYPAAIFYTEHGPCGFHDKRVLTSIDYLNAHVISAIETAPSPSKETFCDGFRCRLGQCIPWNQVCNGIADCRDAADEKSDYCKAFRNRCLHGDAFVESCRCKKSELRCGSGLCLPKERFCDSFVDCNDGTDEPARCNCANYLTLTTPELICDGRRHCFDKSDESPDRCYCKDASFKCDKVDGNEKRVCIPQDFVCDGQQDCPLGDDEKTCTIVKGQLNDPPGTGEVITRSYGVWHSQCYPNETLLETQASSVCKELGYSSGKIVQNYNDTGLLPVVPVVDNFILIKLNNLTRVSLRSDKPIIRLEPPEKTCHRLFVNCV